MIFSDAYGQTEWRDMHVHAMHNSRIPFRARGRAHARLKARALVEEGIRVAFAWNSLQAAIVSLCLFVHGLHAKATSSLNDKFSPR